jgi:hypothetical protein
MIDELNQAVEIYHTKWHKLVQERKDKTFFEGLRPVAIGWKVADRAEYDHMYAALRDQADRIIETWMNGRWIAKVHLKDALDCGIALVKIMERRPGSTDALGLDHLDFYSPAVTKAERILKQEPGLKWSWENNDVIEGYDWISLWFDGTEAKLKAGTVLDIIIAELSGINQKIKS